MKKYLISTLLFLAAIVSCSKEEPLAYDGAVNGVQFDYTGANLKRSVNFADSVLVLTPDTKMSFTVRMRVLGFATETQRKVVVKTRPTEKYEDAVASIVLPEQIVVEPGESTTTFTVVVNRPEKRQKDYAITLYVDSDDSNSDFGQGIDESLSFDVVASETYTKPVEWDAAKAYLGEWNADKYIYLAQMFNKANFYAQDSYTLARYSYQMVNAARAYYDSDPEDPFVFDIPFTSRANPYYDAPGYWGTAQTKYLGRYNAQAFINMASAWDVTTATEREFFAESHLPEVNIMAYSLMVTFYDSYYKMGMPMYYFPNYFYVPFISGSDYQLTEPAWWSESLPYYGEWSNAKYVFILEQMYKDDPTIHAASPIVMDMDYATWQFYVNVAAMTALNKQFSAALAEWNEANPDNVLPFTFPEL